MLSDYTLPYDNNDISITFSAVDLTGYNPSFEYRTNNGDWVKLEKNTIDLKLARVNMILK